MVTMSQKEFQRVKVIENAVASRLSVSEAARLLQLSERQVQRLKRRYRPDSVAWVHHGRVPRSLPFFGKGRAGQRLCHYAGEDETIGLTQRPAPCDKAVPSHDILYKTSRDILYTSARA
jgi:hypothetical protein